MDPREGEGERGEKGEQKRRQNGTDIEKGGEGKRKEGLQYNGASSRSLGRSRGKKIRMG